MKTRHLIIIAALIFGFFAVDSNANTRVIDWKHLNGLLASVAADDYQAFLSHGTKSLQENVSKDDFAQHVSFLRPILVSGYQLTESGHIEKDMRNIIIIWTMYYDSEKPKLVIRVDFDGPGGNVTNFQIE